MDRAFVKSLVKLLVKFSRTPDRLIYRIFRIFYNDTSYIWLNLRWNDLNIHIDREARDWKILSKLPHELVNHIAGFIPVEKIQSNIAPLADYYRIRESYYRAIAEYEYDRIHEIYDRAIADQQNRAAMAAYDYNIFCASYTPQNTPTPQPVVFRLYLQQTRNALKDKKKTMGYGRAKYQSKYPKTYPRSGKCQVVQPPTKSKKQKTIKRFPS